MAGASEQSVRDDIERIDLLFGKTRDGRLEVAFGAGTDRPAWNAAAIFVGEVADPLSRHPITGIVSGCALAASGQH